MIKTYKLEKLYFRFLKPQGITIEKLDFLVTKLFEAGFIEVYQSENGERYAESAKLADRLHRDELFKIIQGLKK